MEVWYHLASRVALRQRTAQMDSAPSSGSREPVVRNNRECFRLLVADRDGEGERAAWWLRHLSSIVRISERNRVSIRERQRRHLDRKEKDLLAMMHLTREDDDDDD